MSNKFGEIQITENSFNADKPYHFESASHSSRNEIVLPKLVAEAEIRNVVDKWQLAALCTATDFRLSIAPDLADAVYNISDLFREGKVHLATLDRQYAEEFARRADRKAVEGVNNSSDLPPPSSEKAGESGNRAARPRQQVSVRLSFQFASGTVRLHRSPLAAAAHKSPVSRISRVLDTGIVSFSLPALSLWVEFAGQSTVHDRPVEDVTAFLLFNLVRISSVFPR